MLSASNKASMVGVASEIVELGRQGVVKVPAWSVDFLAEAIKAARKDSHVSEAELAVPLLTLNLQNPSLKLEREAQRIINRCYKSAFDEGPDLDQRLANLHTAVTCSDYVNRFSVHMVANVWNEICAKALSGYKNLTLRQTTLLLEIAKECENYPIFLLRVERKA